MNTFSKFKTDIGLKLLSKVVTAAISKKFGVDATVKVNGLTLDINEQTCVITVGVDATASMHADDIDKLIFQGGKKDA